MKFFISMFILSIIMYFSAPEVYSFFYCLSAASLFIISAIIFIKKTLISSNFINFHTIFLSVNLVIVFFYPVFIYPINPTFFSVFGNYQIDSNLISQGTGLCLLAMSAYMFGSFSYFNKNKYKLENFEIVTSMVNKSTVLATNTLCVVIMTVSIYFLFKNLGTSYGDVVLNPQSIFLATLIIPITLIINSQKRIDVVKNNTIGFLKVNFLPLLLIFIYSIFSLLIGSRFSIIQLGLIVIAVYMYYVRLVKLRYLIVLTLFSIFFLTYIEKRRQFNENPKISSLFESKPGQNPGLNPIWNNFNDLIINTRNIYKGIEYTNKYGYSYGKQFFFVRMTSPIPFLPTLVCNLLLDTEPVKLTSQQILTDFTRESNPELDYELGSNVVIDVFMEFGVMGVIILFFLFGRFIEFLEINKYFSIKLHVVYLVMLSSAIFMVRSGLFDQFRAVIWVYLLSILLLELKDNFTIKRKNSL